jgi:outer membrane protein assembly factor BamB
MHAEVRYLDIQTFRPLLVTLALIGAENLCGGQQPHILWTSDAPDAIVTSPTLAPDGTVYIATGAALLAVTNSGTLASNKWSQPFAVGYSSGTGIAGTPSVGNDGTLYIGSHDGNLYAFNGDGSHKWVFQAHGDGGSPGIGLDNTIYYEGIRLFAISPAGSTNWTAIIGDSGNFSSPAIGNDGAVYIGSQEWYTLSAFSAPGMKKWSVGLASSPGDSTAMAAGGGIYVTARNLFAFTPDGTKAWSTGTNQFSGASPVIGGDGTIYVKDAIQHKLYAIRPPGEVLWAVLPDGQRYAPPTAPAIAADGTIYYCASNSLLALNPTGQVLWAITYPGDPGPGGYYAGTSPALGSDGTIYAALANRLYAVAGTNGPAKSPWPMWRHDCRHTGGAQSASLREPKKRSDANFQFQLYAQIGQTQMIQTSTDLATWTSLTNVAVTNVPMDVTDLTASNFPSRFYRTVSP